MLSFSVSFSLLSETWQYESSTTCHTARKPYDGTHSPHPTSRQQYLEPLSRDQTRPRTKRTSRRLQLTPINPHPESTSHPKRTARADRGFESLSPETQELQRQARDVHKRASEWVDEVESVRQLESDLESLRLLESVHAKLSKQYPQQSGRDTKVGAASIDSWSVVGSEVTDQCKVLHLDGMAAEKVWQSEIEKLEALEERKKDQQRKVRREKAIADDVAKREELLLSLKTARTTAERAEIEYEVQECDEKIRDTTMRLQGITPAKKFKPGPMPLEDRVSPESRLEPAAQNSAIGSSTRDVSSESDPEHTAQSDAGGSHTSSKAAVLSSSVLTASSQPYDYHTDPFGSQLVEGSTESEAQLEESLRMYREQQAASVHDLSASVQAKEGQVAGSGSGGVVVEERSSSGSSGEEAWEDDSDGEDKYGDRVEAADAGPWNGVSGITQTVVTQEDAAVPEAVSAASPSLAAGAVEDEDWVDAGRDEDEDGQNSEDQETEEDEQEDWIRI